MKHDILIALALAFPVPADVLPDTPAYQEAVQAFLVRHDLIEQTRYVPGQPLRKVWRWRRAEAAGPIGGGRWTCWPTSA
jgi:hypothetical protein